MKTKMGFNTGQTGKDFCDLLANSVGPDQTVRMRSLVWTHAGRNGMKIRKILFSLLLSTVVLKVSGQFDPLVNVESCTRSKLVVSTFGAEENGLIYIQGQDANCKHQTLAGLSMYEFDFSACNIQWEMLFRIVVQKNSGYQTGADKVIPIFCVADRSDIVVSNSNNAQKADDGSQNMTVKPSALMSFYKVVSEEEVSGKEVKLSDTLIMALQLDGQFSDDFDIKARYCIASGIVIIENFCATDSDLFPNFSRLRTGYLMSEFGAFRPTNLEGEALAMNFTCILEVCKDACTETFCGGSQTGWGRKRRELSALDSSVDAPGIENHEREKRQDDSFDIDVGANVNIVEKYSEIQIVTEETMCMNAAVLITIMIFMSAGLVGFSATTFIFYRKWCGAESDVKKSSPEVTQARTDSVYPGQKGNRYNRHI